MTITFFFCPIEDITLQGNERFNRLGFPLWQVCQPGVISTHNKPALQLGVISTHDKSIFVCWQVKIACMTPVPYLTAILTWYSPNAWYSCSRFKKKEKKRKEETIHTCRFSQAKATRRHSHQWSIQLPKDIHTKKVYSYRKTFTLRKCTDTQRHSHQ